MPFPGLGNLLQVDFENIPYSFYKVREVVVEDRRSQSDPGSTWRC